MVEKSAEMGARFFSLVALLLFYVIIIHQTDPTNYISYDDTIPDGVSE